MVVESSIGSRLTGFYRGQVLKHLPHGRCKIYIPSVYDESLTSNPDMLPDAEQAAPLFAGTNNGNGVFSYPNISSIVWCFFANEDQNYPVYFASTLGGLNAFGQHEIIMPPRYQEGKELSDIISVELSSTEHLITAGKNQIKFIEDGILSVQVSNPIRTEASVDFNNLYQLQRQDDHVVSRNLCDKIAANLLSNSHCNTVYDVNKDNGTITQETYFYNIISGSNSIDSCKTFLEHNNKHNINYGSVNVTCDSANNREEYNNTSFNNDKQTQHILRHSLSAGGKQKEELNNSFTIEQAGITLNSKYTKSPEETVSTIKLASTDKTGVFLESENHNTGYKCLVNASSKEGLIEIKIEDQQNNKHSYMYLDAKGTITLDSSEAIILKTKSIKFDATDRVDSNAQYSNMKASTLFEINSSAVNINTTSGKTTIKSNTQTTIV